MQVTLIAAVSEDGYITRKAGQSPESWTSDEDKKQFKELLARFPLQIMGKGTYDTHLPRTVDSTLRVVLTHHPDQYKSDRNINFINSTALECYNTYKDRFHTCAILGGSSVYSDFLENDLVDEMYLTREPIKLGSGVAFLRSKSQAKMLQFEIKSTVVLNDKGTRLEHYVLKK